MSAPNDGSYRPACLADVVPGGLLGVRVGDGHVVVAKLEDALYAVDGTCTHEGAELQNARLQGDTIVCHFHGSCFDVRTGAVTKAPAAIPLRRYDVTLDDDRLVIDGRPAYVPILNTGLRDTG